MVGDHLSNQLRHPLGRHLSGGLNFVAQHELWPLSDIDNGVQYTQCPVPAYAYHYGADGFGDDFMLEVSLKKVVIVGLKCQTIRFGVSRIEENPGFSGVK